MTYWIEYVLVMLPGLLFSSLSILPLALGLIVAIKHLQEKKRTHYLRNIFGSMAAGLVALLFLFGSLFGDDISSSSTAGLAFLFAPIYAALAFGIVYGISALILKPLNVEPISSAGRMLLSMPITILVVLMVGLFKNAIQGNDMTVAHKASNPDHLMYIYEKSLHGEADSFSVPLFLTQNPNTPPEILQQLAFHEHRAIRTHVAQHKATPIDIVKSLQNDSASCVRKAVVKRLGLQESNKSEEPIKNPQAAF